ncbi:MAG: hypothetical protein VX619_12275 [bacterium]|nr:hypothetical protein [bacterium]
MTLNSCFAATLVWVGPPKDPTTESLLMSLAQYKIKLVHVIPNRKLNSLEALLKDLYQQLNKHTKSETAIAYAGYRQDGFLAYLLHEKSPTPNKTFALGSFSTAMELVRLGMDSINDPHTRNNYRRITGEYEKLLFCRLSKCLKKAHKYSPGNLYRSFNPRPPLLLVQGDSDPFMPLKQMTRYLTNNPLLSIENFIIPDGTEDSRTARTLHRFTYFLGQSLQKFLDKTANRNAPENSPFVN